MPVRTDLISVIQMTNVKLNFLFQFIFYSSFVTFLQSSFINFIFNIKSKVFSSKNQHVFLMNSFDIHKLFSLVLFFKIVGLSSSIDIFQFMIHSILDLFFTFIMFCGYLTSISSFISILIFFRFFNLRKLFFVFVNKSLLFKQSILVC